MLEYSGSKRDVYTLLQFQFIIVLNTETEVLEYVYLIGVSTSLITGSYTIEELLASRYKWQKNVSLTQSMRNYLL